MPAAILIRISSKLLSSLMGGLALFCLYYAAQLSNPDLVWGIFMDALKWGGCATAIVYFQGRYLDQ
jgi:hypothetical protein